MNMGAMFAWLGVGLVRILGSLFGSWRTWLGAILIKTILVVVVYNVISRAFGNVLTWVAGKLADVAAPSGTVTSISVADWSLVGAWLVNTLQIPNAFAFVLSVIILKWTLRKIPLVRW
jgi:hypothetical protein